MLLYPDESEKRMYAPERHQAILARARAAGRVEVRDLAEALAVTPETIRRDLTSLERRGLVRRAHGGAVPVESVSATPSVAERGTVHAAEKSAIAAAALAELPEKGSVIIDAGSTTIRLAELVPRDRELTVVTHSVPVAIALSAHPLIHLHLLGGSLRPDSMASVGTWTHQMIGMVTADIAFISVNGITPERGYTTHELSEAAVKTALIRAARRSIVLADHTKFGREEFGRIAPLGAIDTIVTDAGVNPELRADVEASGPDIIVAH